MLQPQLLFIPTCSTSTQIYALVISCNFKIYALKSDMEVYFKVHVN